MVVYRGGGGVQDVEGGRLVQKTVDNGRAETR